MADEMPPRQTSLEFIPIDDDGLTVGKVPVVGVGLRIGLMACGTLALMSPAKARRVAKEFEGTEATAAGLAWVAGALRECADEIEAEKATKQ